MVVEKIFRRAVSTRTSTYPHGKYVRNPRLDSLESGHSCTPGDRPMLAVAQLVIVSAVMN